MSIATSGTGVPTCCLGGYKSDVLFEFNNIVEVQSLECGDSNLCCITVSYSTIQLQPKVVPEIGNWEAMCEHPGVHTQSCSQWTL